MLNTINPANLELAREHWLALSPYLILVFGSMLTILAATFNMFTAGGRYPLHFLTVATLAIAGLAAHRFQQDIPMILFNGMLTIDLYSGFSTILLCSAAILIIFAARKYLENEGIHYSEFYPLIILATLGMVVLASSTELLTLFIALELMSLSVYVLVGMRRRDRLANEAAIKYFVMGGVAAAIYLYGTAMVYGALSTTKFHQIIQIVAANGAHLQNPILIFGFVLIFAGFLFKIAAVPFHMWTPDVYQGAPLAITSFMSTALKAAVFVALIRVMAAMAGDSGTLSLGSLQPIWHKAIWWVAIITVFLGNTVALWQQNIKRMLAYSSIAHTGYLLVGLLAGPQVGYSNILIYLVAYTAMNIGAFTILGMVAGHGDQRAELASLTGLSKRHPWAAAAMTVFLLSLGGLPPTAGFVGKYFMFSGALEAGETLLVLLAVLASVISLYYYLRVVVQMYMREGSPAVEPVALSPFAIATVAVCLACTLYLGIMPKSLINSTKKMTKIYTIQTAKNVDNP